MSGHPAAVPPSSEFPPPHSITSSARGEKARPHRGFFLGSNRVRTSPTWSASRVQPSPLSHAGPSSAVHAAAATLGLVVVEAGRVARGRAALSPASCEPRHGTRPTGDSRAVGSKEKGGRTWN